MTKSNATTKQVSDTDKPDTEEDIQKTLQKLVQQELGWDRDIPQENLSGYLDSIQRLNLLVCIEDHYRIAFEEDEDHSIDSLDQLIAIILSKLQEKQTSEEKSNHE